MKKENIYKFLDIVAALLVVGFAIAFGVDAYKYIAPVVIWVRHLCNRGLCYNISTKRATGLNKNQTRCLYDFS